MKIIKEPKNLLDLAAIKRMSDNDLTFRLKIVVVDDSDVPQVELLRNRGFSVQKLDDVSDIASLSPYDIAFIDIRDIGAKFGSPLEGAYVAKATKERYPNMRVIMLTGSAYDAKYNDVLRSIDGYLPKDANLDRWEDKIKEQATGLGDPVYQWKTLRRRLLDDDVSLWLVYQLEQKYIAAIQARNPRVFAESNCVIDLPPQVKSMALALAQAAVFKAVGV